jgi:hypothetical protein
MSYRITPVTGAPERRKRAGRSESLITRQESVEDRRRSPGADRKVFARSAG